MGSQKRTSKPELNVKQQEFVRQYLVDGNGKKAAIRAGYSPASAESAASVLLARPKIRAALAAITDARAARFELTAQKVIEQAARMAFVDLRQLVDQTGQVIPLHLLPDDLAAALQGLEVQQLGGGITSYKYKIADRLGAIDKLMRHLELFERDNKQAGDAVGNLMSQIHAAGSRVPVR